jgi:hypothetical protein
MCLSGYKVIIAIYVHLVNLKEGRKSKEREIKTDETNTKQVVTFGPKYICLNIYSKCKWNNAPI